MLEAIQHKSPLSDDTCNELERFQQILGLTDRDIAPIEAQIASQTEKVASKEQVISPKAEVVFGGEGITPIKPLAKSNERNFSKIIPFTDKAFGESIAETHTETTLPVVPYAVRNANRSLNKSAHSAADFVPPYRYALLLTGVGIVTGMVLGASYVHTRWQDSQQLQKIKMLASARNYKECLTQAQAVPRKSSRYTDVQKLLKVCAAGVK